MGFFNVVLTIRDSWNQFATPTIKVVSDKPGETSPVEVNSYTDNQIKVSIPIEIEKYPGQNSLLLLTIDRNTGDARFDLQGPQQQEPTTGIHWSENISSFKGKCERQAPRF